MATVSQQIQQIYVGLLGRAADQAGLDYWTAEIEGGVLTIEELRANIVNEQPEYEAGLGSMTRAEAVAALYEALFNRAPEAEGLEYWVNGEGSTVNFDQLILALINGASEADAAALANKVAAAEYYTSAVGDAYTAESAAAAVADVDATEASLDASKAAVDSLVADINLTAALETLLAARQAVADKEADIEDFLVAALDNELVAAVAGEDAETATEANVATAYVNAAQALVDAGVVAANGGAFNGLTSAQQEARISTNSIDLQADIDEAQADLDEAAAELESGVAALLAVVNTRATALEAASAAVAAADDQVEDDEAIANLFLNKGTTDYDALVVGGASVELVDNAEDGEDPVDVLVVNEDGEWELAEGVTLASGVYTLVTGVTIPATRLDPLLASLNAMAAAQAVEVAAENALAAAINAVYNAQDPDAEEDYAFTFDALVGMDVIDVAEDGSISVTYGPGDAPDALVAIDTYLAKVAALESAQDALADFTDAVAAWRAVGELVDALKALNDQLDDLEDAADAALAAIENDVDADDAGLGVDVLEGAENFTDGDDLYLFTAAESDGASLTGFGAEGADKIYIGSSFGLVIGGTNIGANLGSASALEVIAVQSGANTVLYFEGATFAGNSAGVADMAATVTLVGVTAADLVLNDGFLSLA